MYLIIVWNFSANWSADNWVYVCDQLGVSPQDERVDIKFCNPTRGCNFGFCPHRDGDELKTLFYTKIATRSPLEAP
jgi:hypothetical protein